MPGNEDDNHADNRQADVNHRSKHSLDGGGHGMVQTPARALVRRIRAITNQCVYSPDRMYVDIRMRGENG